MSIKISIQQLLPYDIGILWALGSITDINQNRMSFRCKDKYFLERLSLYFNNKIYTQQIKNKTQYVLKTSNVDLQSLYTIGWTERNSNIRDIPILNNNDYKNFLRSYIEIHSTLDYSTRYRRDGSKYKSLRLRIYGNCILIDSINKLLNKNANTNIKSIQMLKNNKTSILYYSSILEIQNIYTYIFDASYYDKYWNNINYKLQNPTKEYE